MKTTADGKLIFKTSSTGFVYGNRRQSTPMCDFVYCETELKSSIFSVFKAVLL